jgi:hypothetical protein
MILNGRYNFMDGFKAYEIGFQGESGYMVSQYKNGKRAVEQFIPKDGYESFCNAIGVVPEIVEESEVN